MQCNKMLSNCLRRAAAAVALISVAGLFAQQASAGCGQYGPSHEAVAYRRTHSAFGSAGFLKTGYFKVSDDGTSPDWGSPPPSNPIVGLWNFKYISEGNEAANIPDGALIDGGATIWFADGNEMTSSAVRNPDTGSICVGTWHQYGPNTYKLNHIGFSWDPKANVAAGPAFIKQFVTLQEGGQTYTGAFYITQYMPDGKTVAIKLQGKIEATRVTVDTNNLETLP